MHLFKTLSVYAFALFFNAALSFATVSLLTHYLNEVDYGIISLYGSFTIFIVPFVSVGVQFTLGVDYFKMDADSFRNHFTNAILIPVIVSILLTVGFIFFHTPLQKITKANLFFLLTLPLSCLLIVLNEITLSLIRNKGKHFLYAGVSISKNIVEIGITILFVIILGFNWQGRLGGALIALIVTGFIMYYLINKWNLISWSFNKKDIINIVKMGVPFIPERLAIFFLVYSDRFFIDHYKGTADVGYYSAGAQIAVIVNLCTLSLISTFHPYIFKNLAASEWNKVKKATLAFVGLSAIIALTVILSTPLIFKLFIGKNFQSGQIYANYLTIGFFLWSIYAAFLAYLLYLKRNKTIMLISIIGMILSISLNFYNVKRFGAIGATYTAMIVYSFMAGACIYAVHKGFNLRKIFIHGTIQN